MQAVIHVNMEFPACKCMIRSFNVEGDLDMKWFLQKTLWHPNPMFLKVLVINDDT